MYKRVLSFVLFFTITLSMSTFSVFADPSSDLNQQKQSQQQKIDEDGKKINQVQGNVDEIQKNINDLASQISNINNTIKSNNFKISDKENAIKNAESDIAKAEDSMKGEKNLFNERIKTFYVHGASGYVEILLDSKNFMDFISKTQVIKSIVNLDRKIISDLNDKEESIKNKKNILNKDKDKLVQLLSDNKKQLGDLSGKKQEMASSQANLNSQLKVLKVKQKSDKDELNNIIDQLKKQMESQAAAGGTGSGSASGAAVVVYAYKFIGDPYVWGANGETITQSYINQVCREGWNTNPGCSYADDNVVWNYNGQTVNFRTFLSHYIGVQAFDCSGFVNYVFKNAGGYSFKGARPTTYSMINEGTPVAKGDYKPGDVIFFNGDEHVGIYAGKGSSGQDIFIEAPSSGSFVRVSDLSSMPDITAVRRVL